MPDEKQPPTIMSADEAFGQDEEWGFKIGEDDEKFTDPQFPEATNPVVDLQQGTPAIVREVDFGDGDVVTIEANDVDEYTRKLIDAQNERVTQMMLNPQQTEVHRPNPPRRYDPPTPPTTDEIGEVMLRLNTDPYGSVDKMVQWSISQQLGMPIEAVQERLQAADNIVTNQYHYQVGQEFLSRHNKYDEYGDIVEGEYYPHPENTKRMLRLLQVEGREISPENYDYAFSKLKSANGLIPFPAGYFDNDEVPAAPQTSTALSGRQSSYPVSASAEFGDDELLRRAGQMSTAQLEAEINKRKYALRGRR